MSQQYGPGPHAPGPPPAPAPGGPGAPGGWGPGPMRPPNQQPKKASRTAWIIMVGAIVAVLLVAGGVVLLVTGKDGKPAAEQTPDPTGTLYTPSPTPSPDDSKGPNDVGVEVGYGIWFTPSKGWLRSPDTKISGQNYILQQFNSRGLIDGYYWVRQTTLYDAKGFAEHLADIETSSYEGVRIGKTIECKPDNPKIKSCYAVSYDGLWVSPKNKTIKIKMRGFVTAYQDQFDRVTATDAALEARVYDRRVNELKYMNNSVVKSF